MSAFETYQMYLALKYHFSREHYDFFKYHGKTNTSVDSFMKRKDRFQFQKLSRKVSGDDMRNYIIANLLAGKAWSGDLLQEDAEDIHKNFMKIWQSLSYHFSNELDNLFKDHNPITCFKPKKDGYPDAFMYYMSGKLSIHSLVILNNMIGFISKWDKVYESDFVWPKHSILIKKYAPFLEYDKRKLKNILKDKIKEYEHGEEQETSRTPRPQREEAA